MDKTNPAPRESGDGAEVEKPGSANLSLSPQNFNTPSRADTVPPEDRHGGPLKGSSARGQSTTRVSPARHRINARPLPANRSFEARLARLSRLAARQAHDAERFDDMRLAAAQYQADPSPANAVRAHLAARRYI